MLANDERLLKTGEVLLDIRLRPINRSDEFPPDHAFAVDDVRFRKLECPIEHVALLVGIANRLQIARMLAHELFIRTLVNVHADGQHRHATTLQLGLHGYQRGHLFDAGWTPRRPEVQDDNLPVKVSKRYCLRPILDGKVGGIGSDASGLGTAIAADQKGQQYQQKRGSPDHLFIITPDGAIARQSSTRP